MNNKFVKITSIVIAIAFLSGIFAQFAYMFVFAEPMSEHDAINAIENRIKNESSERFRIMCEKGIGSSLGIILSAENVTDFTDRIVIANELAEYDRNMIKAVSKIKKELGE